MAADLVMADLGISPPYVVSVVVMADLVKADLGISPPYVLFGMRGEFLPASG